jgi:hypothetical protein
MTILKSLFAFVCCAGLIGSSAYYHGRFNDQTVDKAALLAEAAERVALLPLKLDDWEGKDRIGVDEEAMRRGGAARYLARVYQRSGTNESLSVLLLCGKPGPISVHTPEVCTAGVNFSADSNQRKWSPAPDSELNWQTFTSRIEGQPNLEIAWGWSLNGQWIVPKSPRITFGREPSLYKLYVVRACRGEGEPSPSMKALLADLIPTIQKTVFDKEARASIQTKSAPSSDSLSAKPTSSRTPNPRNKVGDAPRG